VPSHRADTPADASTALLDRPAPHAPLQRRRDLRARAAAPTSGPADNHLPAAFPHQREAALSWLTGPVADDRAPAFEAPTRGALALDPLFVPAPWHDEEGDGDRPLATVQPLRRPRGKERAAAQTTRRALRGTPAPVAPARRGAGSVLPQAGIAGVLGIATIAVPLCSALGVVPAAAAQHAPNASGAAAAAALTPLPPFPLAAQPPLTALSDKRLLPDERPAAEVPAGLAAPAVRLTSRASRGAARPVLPGCEGQVPDMAGVQNGRLPASMLCTLWDPKRQLRSDAAVALAKLNVAYTKRFGHAICFNDAYRSLAEQYAIKARRGGYAARPGTSEHGWGLAVDLCDGVDDGPSSATYAWLRANAPAYGWENPTWARSGGGGPYEPWHWEYMPGEQGQSKGD
jgi:hypothetical protein